MRNQLKPKPAHDYIVIGSGVFCLLQGLSRMADTNIAKIQRPAKPVAAMAILSG